jgi:glycosyltransferase involved in cell wall biosynthesis
MERPVRLLVVDNLAVESHRREVYRVLGRMFKCEVHLIVPVAWKETRDRVICEPETGGAMQLHPSRILFGFRHQRVLYTGLGRTVRMVQPDFILAVAQPESYAAAQVCIVRSLSAPRTKLGLFSSRNIDYLKEGFPYKAEFTHRLCDRITRRSRPDVCFYRPAAAESLLAPYARRLTYVPHVVDCSLFRMAPADSPSGTRSAVTVGYVGRLVKEKGVHNLLEAMQSLPPQVRLMLVGTGPETSSLRQFATASGLSDRVEFHPSVPYRGMPGILNRMDVLVLPSLETRYWKELFGRVLIEAMACEVPVVASHSGGIPEVVGEAGILVPVGDTRALVNALGSLCGDPAARRELGRAGRERALRNFDIPVVADILGNEIMTIVGSTLGEEARR